MKARHIFEQEITIAPADKYRTFFEIERARCVRVYLDGEEISSYEEQTISTPHVFELTGHEGIHRLRVSQITVIQVCRTMLLSIHRQQQMRHRQIGMDFLVIFVFVRKIRSFLSQVRVYPKDGGKLRAEIDLDTYDEPLKACLF